MPAPQPTAWQPSNTTLAGAASQAVAPKGRGIRSPWVAGALVVVVGVGLGVMLALRRESEPASKSSGSSGANDTGIGVVHIATVPQGATVRIDGQARGVAPVVVRMPRGTRIAIVAEREGFVGASQTFTVGEGSQEVSLTMSPLPVASAITDAGVPDAPIATTVPVDAPTKTTKATKQTTKDSSARGSARPPPGSANYNPNDVGGD